MKISIKGVRGSIPISGPETSLYGGNTSCVTVLEDGWILVLDGGTGIQRVTLPDISIKRIDILLTHLHFDHLQGLGFFGPLFDSSKEVHIWAPASATLDLRTRISRYLSPPLFPVLIRDLPCQLSWHEISRSYFEIGPFSITSRSVIHPGPTLGYRIRHKKAVFTYIPDHEPALGPSGLLLDKKWLSGFDLISEADLLIHDAQYTATEYLEKIGWGHSSMEDAIKLAEFAGVKRLLFTHHDPARTDSQLSGLQQDLLQTHGSGLDFEFAKEGMEIDLG
jgi:ribonuclease BN (tRNA processing enzyme)